MDKPIKCDCCNQETMAMVKPDGTIVVQDRRHGKTHTLTLAVEPSSTARLPKDF